MKLEVFENSEIVDIEVAKKIIHVIKEKPNALICIAGGDTPKGVFKQLIDAQKNNCCDFKEVSFISLDEWVGISDETPGSCKQTLYDGLYTPLNLKESQIHFFNGKAESMIDECKQMDKIVAEHDGIDFVLLGIGMNGHLGFNEPGTNTKNSSVLQLSPTTKEVSVKYFNKELPLRYGITLGMSQLTQAKNIVLMATSEKKREIVNLTFRGEKTNQVPSSLMQGTHAILCVDEEAGRDIK